MKLKDIHLKEIKEVVQMLRSNIYYKPTLIFLKDKDIEANHLNKEDYIHAIENDSKCESIIAGYYISNRRYYYLEEVDGWFIITKKVLDSEIKVLLGKKYNDIFKQDMNFIVFKKSCKDLDIKKQLFNCKGEI